MLVVYAAAIGWVDVRGLGYHPQSCGCLWSVLCLKSCWCPWTRLTLGTIPVSVAQNATGDHVEAQGSCWCRRSGGCPRSVLSYDTLCKSLIHLPADWKGQKASSAVASMTKDSVQKEWHRRLLWQPTPSPQKVSTYKGSHRRELLKVVIKMLKCSSPQ